MSNYNETFNLVYDFLRAQTPFISLESVEPARVDRLLQAVSNKLRIKFEIFSETKKLKNNKKDKDDLEEPLTYILDNISKLNSKVYVLNDFRYMNNDNAYSRQLLNLIYLAKENACSIILVSADPVWSRLGQNGMHVKLDLPNREERIDQIKEFTLLHPKKCSNIRNDSDIAQIANMLGGMSSQQIEMLLMSSITRDEGLTLDTVKGITKNKLNIYGHISSITDVQLDDEIHVSGLGRLKDWLKEKRKVFFAKDEDLKRRHLIPPKGVLLCGITGCGKSLSVKMIAKEWELPLYRFDIDSILNKYVGESEKNMRMALEYIDNVSPCVLWIDEIEKILNVSSDGNETTKRILGQFLYWMQEGRARVFLVATANQIDMLPSELFRNGRFSEKFFIDLPKENERKEAIKLYCNLSLLTDIKEDELQKLASLSEGFSYADIEMAIKNMAEEMMINNIEVVNYNRLEEIFKSIVSTYNANKENIRKNREWGVYGAVNASY